MPTAHFTFQISNPSIDILKLQKIRRSKREKKVKEKIGNCYEGRTIYLGKKSKSRSVRIKNIKKIGRNLFLWQEESQKKGKKKA